MDLSVSDSMQAGNTIGFYLLPRRNLKSTEHFLCKALNSVKDGEKPEIINTDGAP